MSTLPHRFSERSFRRYELIITAAIERFPNATVVKPSDLGLAAETVRGRLRDAISSLHNNKWAPTTVNLSKFYSCYDQIVVSLRADGTVIVGDKDSAKGHTFQVFEALDPTQIVDMTSHNNFAAHNVLVVLAHNQAFKKRIRVAMLPAEVADFSSNYDIVLAQQTDGTYLLS